MKMKKSLSAILTVFAILVSSCSNWMKDDDFYNKIENDVKVANAASVNVYVRYANSKMGTTDPSGSTVLKEDIPAELIAITNEDYGFVKWVAFSTKDFPSNKQHSNLFYESAEKYTETFKPLELPASEVIFEDPTNPSTKVTLKTARQDIFITPLVAKRPTVVTSVPSNGRTDVVKNSQVRILFSKPIDESSLKDESGNSNIQITSGRAVLTENSDDLDALDITDHFNIKLSKTKKMLTISAKKDDNGKAFLFDGNSQISINIFEDVCDTDGYKMNGNYKFSFTTGTKVDSLAPFIDKLSAGIDEDCMTFQQYKFLESENHTQSADAATNTLSDYVTADASLPAGKKLLKQRVTDKINIYVRATDIAGAGANVDKSDPNVLSESDVALVQIRASLYVDKAGKPVTTSAQAFKDNSNGTDSTSVLAVREFGYAMGIKDSACQITTNFEEIKDENGNNLSSGTLFTYDLSSLDGLNKLDDGLIKIDLWAVDMVGNSGDSESYAATYDNGYRSIFVVKDTTAPDAVAARSKLQITSEDNGNNPAPYGWFNSDALSNMKIQDKEDNIIRDANNEALAADINDLMWAFKLGNDTNWKPSANAAKIWSPIHQNGKPVIKKMSDAAVSSDGPVYITMCIKDDLGNVSDPVVLDAINYDNTAPSLPSSVSWVKKVVVDTETNKEEYQDIVATTDKADLSASGHVLKIPFTEESAGLRRIKVEVTKKDQTTKIPQSDYKVFYEPQSGTEREITFAGNAGEYKTFNVSDSNKITTGTLYISGIQIGADTGSYEVTVTLWDSSLNKSTTNSEISIDTTAPVIKKVYIPGLKKSITATQSSGITESTQDGWFLPREWIRGTNGATSSNSIKPGFIPLYIFVNEKDSGIKKIDFYGDHVILFNSASTTNGKTKLYKIENFGQQNESKIEIPETDYTVETKAIILKDNKTLKSSGDFVILVENAGFNSYRTTENIVKVRLYDLATLPSIEKEKISPYKDINNTTEINGVLSDSFFDISNNTYTLIDRGYDAANGTSVQAQSGFTNEDSINLLINFKGENTGYSANSRYNRIKITGAKFTDLTKVTFDSTNIDYELSADKTEMTFMEKNNGAPTGKYVVVPSGAEITISDLKLDSNTDGAHTVKINVYDLAGWGWDVSPKEETITIDTVAPVWKGKGLFSAKDNRVTSENVYPHSGKSDAADKTNYYGIKLSGSDDLYFYKNSSDTYIRIEPDLDEDHFERVHWGSAGDSEYFYYCSEGEYSVYAYDKAGNKSSEIKIHLVDVPVLITEDDSRKDIKTNLENEVQLVVPEGANLEKNTFLNGVRSPEGPRNSSSFDYYNGSQTSKIYVFNYILKQFDGKNYQLKVPVHNYAAGGEKTVPIEQYGVSHQYTEFPSTADECAYDPFTPRAPNWHDYKLNTTSVTDGHLSSKVDENGDIIITLPNHNCPPVSLWLKDACGNTEYILLNPGLKDKLGTLTVCETRPGEAKQGKRNQAVAYVIDNRVGVNDSHNGSGSNEVKTYPENTLVSKNDISFYKKNTSDKIPNLQLQELSDSCRFPYVLAQGETTYNGLADLENNPSDYTLKSKIIVWQGSGNPAYEKFYDSNIFGSAWYAWKEFFDEAGASSAFILENNFPEFDNATHDTGKYELWYIIEDRVGNYEVRPITYGNTADWLYDVTPPKLDVKQATNVNNIDGKNYYSNSSSVKYSIEDKQSGIQHNGASAYDYSSFASRVQLYPQTGYTNYQLNGVKPKDPNGEEVANGTSGTIAISGVKDWAENEVSSVGLENAGSNIWIYQPNAPAFASSSPVQITAVNPPAGKRFNTDSSNEQWYIDSSRMITHIELKMTMDDSEPLLGWIIKNDDSAPENRIYTVADTLSQNGNPAVLTQITQSGNVYTYSIDKTKTNNGQIVDDTGHTWNDYFNKKPLKFYAVNRAGIINIEEPIVINFTAKPVPALDGSLEYSDVIKYPSSDSTDNYIKSDSKVIFKTKENPDKCTIYVGNKSVTFILSYYLNASTGKYEIPLGFNDTLKAASGAALKLVLSITGGEDSDEIELKGPANTNKWTFDETAPAISLTPSQGQNIVETNGIYYTKSENVKFAFTSDEDTIKYMMKKKVGDGNYSTYSQITLDQNGGYQITSSDTLTEYSFVAVDKAGNQTQTPAVIKLQKDTTTPTGSITSYTLKYENSVTSSSYYRDSNDEQTNTRTIIYNPSYLNTVVFTPTITDTASGPDGNLYYKLNNGEITLMNDKTITLAENTGTATYQIYAKDKVGNEALIKTFVFKVNKPAPSNTVTVQYNNQDLPHVSDDSYSTTYTPKYIGVDGGNAVVMPASANFKITMNAETVLENSLSYAVTYIAHSDNLPGLTVPSSGWVNASMTDGKVSVTVEGSKLTGEKNYIFIWFKDVLGNTAVYGLAYKGDANWQSGWWTPDLTGPTATVSLEFPGNTDDDKYTSTSTANGIDTITYNSNKISSVKVNGAASLNDTGLGITNKVLYYRESGASDSVAIGDAAISISTFAGDKTYQIFAKDNGGNETVFKTFKFVADGSAPNVTYTYEFKKDGVTDIANYYTVADPDANGIRVITYNPDKLNDGSFEVTTNPSETVSLKKNVNNQGEADFDGSIGLSLTNGQSVPIILTAYDNVWNATIFAKFSFVANNTLGVQAGGNGDPQGNKFSSGLFTGLLDTSKIVGSGDLAASQISAMSERGIIMNKDLDTSYVSSTTSDQSRAARKAAKAAKKAAKKAEKASAKTAKEKPLVQEIASQVEDLGITDAFVDSVVLEDLSLSEQIIKEDISQVTAKTDFVMSPVEKVEIADAIESSASSPAQAQQEKSSSKAAIIVVMLAILSALAGAWYLRKGRIKR